MTESPTGSQCKDARDEDKFLPGKPVEEDGRTSDQQFGDAFLSGDDPLAKVRKPYTITKQRERWTEEEHQKFLEALKLYGRAWRRIEEHIGTKTAVQIRSHAQKFFSKLEREQATGNIVPGTAQDIDIPPPRPKRKPSHPYPRKATMENTVNLSPGLFGRPTTVEGSKHLDATDMGKSQEELKLFGHTVVVPTVTRAVAPPATVMHNLAKGSESEEVSELVQQAFEVKNGSDTSMLGSENDSSNGQRDNRSVEQRKEKIQLADQQPPPPMELAALYYSKFWESLQASERNSAFNFCNLGMDRSSSPFPFWPPSVYTAAAAAAAAHWPGGTSVNNITASVLRSILTGTPSELYKVDNSPASFAAATIAAASAWWTLQGSVQPSFLSQCMVPVQDAQMTDKQDHNEGIKCTTTALPPEDDDDNVNISPSFKRLSSESVDEGKRRVRSRSFKEDDHQPPSSSGSDDGNEHLQGTKQVNGDGNASGNSGPSSNSSRCGITEATVKSEDSSSDKEKTEDILPEGASKTVVKAQGFQHASSHHFLHGHRFRRNQRVARPSRSSGSDGEQRKEVSQEGRMAFQALFSHQKLPQSFSHKNTPKDDHQLQQRRFLQASDTSDFESVSQWSNNNAANINFNSVNNKNNDWNKTFNTCGIIVNKSASDNSRSSFGMTTESSQLPSAISSAASKSRRRSGFVPYSRTMIAGNGGGGESGVENSSTRSIDNNYNSSRDLMARASSSCALEDHQASPIAIARNFIVEEEVKQS